MVKTCLFCQLVHGEIPSYRVYEDEQHVVLLDAHPLTRGHLLVCTKAHIGNVYDLDEEPLLHIMLLVKKFSLIIKGLFQPIKVIMMTHNLAHRHLHIHLIPAYSKYDVLPKEVAEITEPASEEELENVLYLYRSYDLQR